jgi:hypothetical protein
MKDIAAPQRSQHPSIYNPCQEDHTVTPEIFKVHIAEITTAIQGRPLNQELGDWLNENHGPTSPTFQKIKAACVVGVAEGWLCEREGGGIKYGRVFKPSDALSEFSVDVVDMQNIAGPHHQHPLGEIDLIMPIDGQAEFDGHPEGWLVCPPGSSHQPTVTQGRALVLYLLPNGKIEFTR